MVFMMKKATLSLLLFSNIAFSFEWTEARVIDRIQMSANGVYYFVSQKGWGASGCPNAVHIFVRKNEAIAADAILSTVLSAQAQGKTIKARGECKDSNHFNIDYIIQK